MTTAFQTVFDMAESISINRRKKVSQSAARDGTVRATSLGAQTWQFEVKLPDGPRWTDMRPLIERMEALDRVTVGTVKINHPGQAWLSGYQGNLTDLTNITVNTSSGNTLAITGGTNGLAPGQFKFRSGDFIQLGTGRVYSVVEDVAYNSNTITVHRPVKESGSFTLKVGPAVEWRVICVNFPQWSIFQRDQVSWDGAFVFAEDLT